MKAKLLLSTAALLTGLWGPAAMADQSPHPWADKSLSPDRRAELLEQAMTDDERYQMLHGIMALPFKLDTLPAEALKSAGYFPAIPRLGVPALQETDASLGVANPLGIRPGDVATALPSGLAIAAGFNRDLARQGGAVVGDEAARKGFNILLAGGVNLARNMRNGRNFEYLGEDPLLAGTLDGEMIRGVQDQGIVSTVKHFALNNQEDQRHLVDVRIDRAAARESDLLAFEIAIEGGKPGSVMCSYNKVNGPYACANPWLLNDVLKGDWHYPGWVMSDWGAVPGPEAAAAGLDQESGEQIDPQVFFAAPLRAEVAAGRVPAARISDMVRRIARSLFAAGLFDTPSHAGQAIDYDAHQDIARQIAESGIVLLKNDKSLPLPAKPRKIAVIGGHADIGVLSGGGSAQVTPVGGAAATIPIGGGELEFFARETFDPSSPVAALRAKYGAETVVYDNGGYPSQAAKTAAQADIAIVFATQWMTEGVDVPDLTLPDGQDALIEAVAKANPHTIVVLETGGPVRMPWLSKVAGVVEAWYPGNKGGDAIANVLSGTVNPSGHLPISFPATEHDGAPSVTSAGKDGPEVVYAEGSTVGYRRYAHDKIKPLFPFGFGLSYTRFAYRNLAVSGTDGLSVSFDVVNTGTLPGAAAPQAYLVGRPTDVAGERLVAFDKVMLQPGETRHVSAKVDKRLLADFDEKKHSWVIAPGLYKVAVGGSATDLGTPVTTAVEAQTLAP